MTRWYSTLAGLLLLLSSAAPARANWFCGVMDPYPGYGHPSYYFPPAMASFYAGYGYASLLPGAGYAPATPSSGAAPSSPGYTVTYQTYTVTQYQPSYTYCASSGGAVMSCVMVPYLANVTVPVYVRCP